MSHNISADSLNIFERLKTLRIGYFDGFMQDCSNSIANALELLQSCTKPSIWIFIYISNLAGVSAAQLMRKLPNFLE